MSNGIKFCECANKRLNARNRKEMGEVLKDIHEGSRQARITHWKGDIGEERL